jgi:hypothetical protein
MDDSTPFVSTFSVTSTTETITDVVKREKGTVFWWWKTKRYVKV